MNINAIDLREVIYLASAFSVIISTIISVFMFVYMRERSRSRYDEEKNKAVLSDMRRSYESMLYDVNRRLLSTEERWRDVNHLLISAQESQPASSKASQAKLTDFLKAAGVTGADLEVDLKQVIVLTPFSSEFDEAYRVVAEVCTRAGFKCIRGDEEYAAGEVFSHIIRQIVKSRLVVANISGRNPNVYYELGVAHGIDKPTVLLSNDITEVPFDLKTKRIILFKDVRHLRDELSLALIRVIA